jgi:2-C-methyl-D-erythritol 4-phosphate cytidylyltransferase
LLRERNWSKSWKYWLLLKRVGLGVALNLLYKAVLLRSRNLLEGSLEKIAAVILASGTGERFGDQIPKQFIKLAGLPLLVHTLRAFQSFAPVKYIVVVTNEAYVDSVWELVSSHRLDKVVKVVVGGATRQESSRIGLDCCPLAEATNIYNYVCVVQ